jgi:Rab5 GDP/GTP exchange factor
VWAIAKDELRKINLYRTPGEKIACVVKCASVIFRSLNLAAAKNKGADDEMAGALGADDFLPVFIMVVMRSMVPKLASNCEYIQSFYNPAR